MTEQNLSAVLHAIHDLRIEDRPVPEAGHGEVLVRVEAVGICGSDVHYYEHGRIGDFVVEKPMVIGHEAAGTIEAVGEGVPASRVGELVALEPGVPCRRCGECLAGRYNLCPDVVFFATPPVDGAITRRVAIDAQFAHPVPAGITAEEAAMAEPVSVGVWACRRAGVGVGDRVLVTGAGPIGLLAAQVARAFGAETVRVTDLDDVRLAKAAGLGFETRRADARADGEFDVLLECSGAAPAFRSGLSQLARAGRAVLIGMGADTVELNVPLVQGRELTVTGLFRYANCYPAALQLIGAGAVDAAGMITHRFGLEETEAAMTVNGRDPEALKAMVLPQQRTVAPRPPVSG
ncbi:NAD(P)-dependent alcohol dehydrogenase [Zhihengliuella salsuginis]|uniref:Sorbitol dehydrogenase n=1 Tax=Zhihengliuella salsuginis TaxID=578222 RepID=A0ABQ3GJG3_9MICC|nr:NAD(P)-dependent alcohol dehydrogenase [Zhihengliuella salsuginis]GHD05414.1 sorbitol dehydrogenase [Zhihengliuella salsuginis]